MAVKKKTKTKRRKKLEGLKTASAEPRSLTLSTLGVVAVRQRPRPARGTGSAAGGQSGALQGLPRQPYGEEESVEELVAEGQAYEADFTEGVEHASDAEGQEIHTHADSDRKTA